MTELKELSSAALFHRTYVTNLLKYYQKNDIRAGDPSEGVWQNAHYPLPKRLGGQETVALLREHHAVQGVLQSEEFGVCCTSGAFSKYLVGTEYEERQSYWLGEHIRELNQQEWSDERRKRHGEIQRARFERDGVSEETRRRRSESAKGVPKPHTDEWNAAIKAAHNTPEAREKHSQVSLAARREKPGRFSDPYVVYDTATGRVSVYTSRAQAAERVGLAPYTLTRGAKTGRLMKKRYLITKHERYGR